MRIKYLFLAPILFIINLGLPTLGNAQYDCHGVPTSGIELDPEMTVTGGGHPTDDHVALEHYVSPHDRDEAVEALLALAVGHHVECGRLLRARFLYDEDRREYRVNILVRDRESCWSAVRDSVLISRWSGERRLGSGRRPLAAIIDADAHGNIVANDVILSCAEAPPPETTGVPPPEPQPQPAPDPGPVSQPETPACVPSTVTPADSTSAVLLDRISASQRAEVYHQILERLDIECGHDLTVLVSRSADGRTYEVDMSYDLVPHQPHHASGICADFAVVDVNLVGHPSAFCPSRRDGASGPCGPSLLGVLRDIAHYGEAAVPC